MQLGTFTKDPATGVYAGDIRSLTGAVENVRIIPRVKAPGAHKDAPDFDVIAGKFDSNFGAGWTQKRASDGIEYISLRLHDPAFNDGNVLRPALWPRREGGFVMIHEPLDPNATADPAPARPNGADASVKKTVAAPAPAPSGAKPA